MPRSAAALRSSADKTGQMSWHGASKKVNTTALPRSSASDTSCPDWSTSEKSGAGAPERGVIPMNCGRAAPTRGVNGDEAGGETSPAADVVVDWPVLVAPGLSPTLESTCSSSTPPMPSTARTATAIRANWRGTFGSATAKAAARSESVSIGGKARPLGDPDTGAPVSSQLAASVDPDDGIDAHGHEQCGQVGDREAEESHGPAGARGARASASA